MTAVLPARPSSVALAYCCGGGGEDEAAAADDGALEGRVRRVVGGVDELADVRVVRRRDDPVSRAAARVDLLVDGRPFKIELGVVKAVAPVYKKDSRVLVSMPPAVGGGPRRRKQLFERELRVGWHRVFGDLTLSEDQRSGAAAGQSVGLRPNADDVARRKVTTLVAGCKEGPAIGEKDQLIVQGQRRGQRDGVAPTFADAASLERRGQRLVVEEGVPHAELG